MSNAGDLDLTFGINGLVITDFSNNSNNDRAYSVVIDINNKIVVAGHTDVNGSDYFALARYDNLGILDTTFGINGLVITDFSNNSNDESYSVVIDNNNKIVVAGYTDANGSDDFALARYLSEDGPIPISNICFPSGTPIQTDQGMIAIEKINPNIHTINKKPIIDITKTITSDKYLIGFKKNALGLNYPSENTRMSQEHKLLYAGKMCEAKTFLNKFEKVIKVKYNGEILYNVLMEEHSQMRVNNLICETLHPENIVAKLYTKKSKYTNDERDKIVVLLKECIKNKDYKTYNRIVESC